MKIEIVNLQTVQADGVIYGNFSQAASRLPSETDNLQTALEEYAQGGEDARGQLSDVSNAFTDFKSLYIQGRKDKLDAIIANDAKTDKQREIDSLTAKRDEAQAELDALTQSERAAQVDQVSQIKVL